MRCMSDHGSPLREEEVDPDPLRQFTAWFREAETAGVRMPEAAALATASSDERPVGADGARQGLRRAWLRVLFNYASRKGRELAVNPRAALLFHWDPLGRQVRIEGPVARTSAEESAAYVRERPRASQLSALASPQSQIIDSRQALERRVAELEQRCRGSDLPLPSDWGGFRLVPETVELWQQRQDRLHDRLRYRRGDDAGWAIERLAP